MSMDNEVAPIIVKKIKKAAHGHHGGAWKVAYADFVTAMMAFFLLMWLLNATSEEQKLGISNYFSSVVSGLPGPGSDGILGGLTMASEGVLADVSASITIDPQHPASDQKGDGGDPKSDAESEDEEPGDTGQNEPAELEESLFTPTAEPVEEKINMQAHDDTATKTAKAKEDERVKELAKKMAEKLMAANAAQNPQLTKEQQALLDKDKEQKEIEKLEDQDFQKIEQSLKQALDANPELKELEEHLLIDVTHEGLRSQLVDQQKKSMFELGSSDISLRAKELLAQVYNVTNSMDNKISITGHTDSLKYAGGNEYSNWELSTDRANASRRLLIDKGFPAKRIAWVVGKADSEPLIKNNPTSPQNRRISIVLLRKSLVNH